ncbi:hypothetical protein BGZ70_002147 [Mortierella alpina]|uniref:Carbohydrate kinase PfkB domain-containing protein n=1 Tax=Mortierella alpina TaxID=64518 RepID=A0A9P6IWC0_MORAP|nr:hypothetical protein BGZ70_002147 [Mortierella alpina]
MDVLERLPIDKMKETIARYRPRTICFDANLSVACMQGILETCRERNIITLFEPTSEAKCDRALDGSMLPLLNEGLLRYASPNEYELRTMAVQARTLTTASQSKGALSVQRHTLTPAVDTDAIAMAVKDDSTMNYEELLSDAAVITQYIPTLFIKLGSKGVLVCQRTRPEEDAGRLRDQDTLTWRWFQAHEVNEVKSVTGAGDSFVASIVASLHTMTVSTSDPPSSSATGLQFWKHLDRWIMDAQTAATLTLETYDTVSPLLAQTQQAKTIRLLQH